MTTFLEVLAGVAAAPFLLVYVPKMISYGWHRGKRLAETNPIER